MKHHKVEKLSMTEPYYIALVLTELENMTLSEELK